MSAREYAYVFLCVKERESGGGASATTVGDNGVFGRMLLNLYLVDEGRQHDE